MGYSHERYQRNKNTAEYKASMREIRARRYARIIGEIRKLREGPCEDCGNEYPWYVMDFDHVRGKKVHTIAHMTYKKFTTTQINTELAKCDLVCANCHKIRTHKRRKK